MSGVIVDGVQWEHCNECGKFVRLENLGFLKPDKNGNGSKDVCLTCVQKMLVRNQRLFSRIVPAASWTKTRS